MPELLNQLNCEQIRIIRSARPVVIVYVVAVSLCWLAIDLAYVSQRALPVASMLSWAAGYLLTFGLMRNAGFFRGGQGGGVVTYFVLGVAVQVSLIAAFALLIVPGLYLLMRLLPVYAVALANGGVVASIRGSWVATQGSQEVLAKAMIGPLILLVLSITGSVADLMLPGPLVRPLVVMSDVLFPLGMAWLTVLGIAVFAVLGMARGPSGLNEAEKATA